MRAPQRALPERQRGIAPPPHPRRRAVSEERPYEHTPRTRQRYPRPVHGRRAARQLRAPRHADGHGRHRPGAVVRLPALQPRPTRTGYDRDRFVLSNGHGSMLLYSVSVPDRLSARRSRTSRASASSAARLPGIRSTTCHSASRPPPGRSARDWPTPSAWRSPRRCWRAQFNRDGLDIVDHYTYVFCGDGCLMEGISHEACSFAGTLGLGKLIVFYDDNGISIDGKVVGWFTDDTPKRFEAYGWHVMPNVDGHDAEAVSKAVQAARAEKRSPVADLLQDHHRLRRAQQAGHRRGARRGARSRRSRRGAPAARLALRAVRRARGDLRRSGTTARRARSARRSGASCSPATPRRIPELAQEFERRMRGELPARTGGHGCAGARGRCCKQTAPQATRAVLAGRAQRHRAGAAGDPRRIGRPHRLQQHASSRAPRPSQPARGRGDYMHYGVREFGMTGDHERHALHGGLHPLRRHLPRLLRLRPQRRAARLPDEARAILLVYTHDSIGLGEDGPTHQPIEQLASLRAMPHMNLWRPCDAVETAVAWTLAIERQGPTALVLTRQATAAAAAHAPRSSRASAAAATC